MSKQVTIITFNNEKFDTVISGANSTQEVIDALSDNDAFLVSADPSGAGDRVIRNCNISDFFVRR